MSTTLAKPGGTNTSGVRAISKAVPVIVWRDVVVMVDEGNGTANDYVLIEERVHRLASKHPGGLAVLIIIPSTARPPPDDVRRAIKASYEAISPHVRGACWFVDGRGFRGATVRAALAGLRLFVRPHYPTHITDDLEDGVKWSLSQLGKERESDLAEALFAIRRERSMLGQASG